ncbi:uncharacterized protein EI90DRAFT_3040933 [Cantharellus anzutake]|uniref:uncharacterized protein n=1 Tax=Cantharellus anzutake TaxID=1750568 RepID=UPI001904FA43|nr:uncharacterized protein EI90DRAFT_3040933 [Cantharellus anzutake]KAF8337883.1 hypothetical protein EI90DRAFT_3040933 [Cantharellus anzutake]
MCLGYACQSRSLEKCGLYAVHSLSLIQPSLSRAHMGESLETRFCDTLIDTHDRVSETEVEDQLQRSETHGHTFVGSSKFLFLVNIQGDVALHRISRRIGLTQPNNSVVSFPELEYLLGRLYKTSLRFMTVAYRHCNTNGTSDLRGTHPWRGRGLDDDIKTRS